MEIIHQQPHKKAEKPNHLWVLLSVTKGHDGEIREADYAVAVYVYALGFQLGLPDVAS